jgi:hypothetical protein
MAYLMVVGVILDTWPRKSSHSKVISCVARSLSFERSCGYFNSWRTRARPAGDSKLGAILTITCSVILV